MNLTLICISYNRPAFLKRLIRYHQFFMKNAKLLIMDGSNFSLEVSIYNKENIIYKSRPGSSYFDRWIESGQYLKTKYTLSIGDDEFYLPSTITNCINFLEKNKNYITCGGKPILFTIFFKKIIHVMPVYEGISSNEKKLALDRQRQWLKDTLPVSIYSVIRTYFFKNIIRSLKKIDRKLFNDPSNIIEDIVELTSAYQGKNKILSKYSWFRSQENKRISLNNFSEPPHEFWKKNNLKKKFFINIAYEILLKQKKKHLANYKKNLDIDYFLHFQKYQKNKKNIFKIVKKQIIKIFFLLIPTCIKKFIRYKFRINGLEIEKFFKTQSGYNLHEIKKIKKLILNFYKNKETS